MKGVSGNPGGRPKQDTNLRALARAHTPEAIATLVQIMQNRKAAPTARIHACVALLDRGHGKPVQTLAHDIPVLEKDSSINVIETARQVCLTLEVARQMMDRQEHVIEHDGGSDF